MKKERGGTGEVFFEPITQTNKEEAEKQLVSEQRTIDFDTKEFTVELLVHKLVSQDMCVPSYQRKFVWPMEKRSRFIESVVLGLPIPYMFCAENLSDGRLEVVDGAQRMWTLQAFVENRLRLVDLEKLDSINGFAFEDLPSAQQRRFKNRTLRMIVLSGKADENIRFDIFERINSGSLLITPSELRKGAFPGKFYDLVKKCARMQEFLDLCPISKLLKDRGEGEELVLRFFAYSERYEKFRHDVTRFLNEYVRDKNKECAGDPGQVQIKEQEFLRVLKFIERFFPNGFAKTQNATSTPRVRFEAMSVGVHLALTQVLNLKPKGLDWLDSTDFKSHTTTHASNSGPKLRGRVEYVRDHLIGG